MGVSVVGPLADADDVQRLGVDVSDTGLVEFLLESVSDAVRDAAGTPITAREVTIEREGTWDQDLLLPGSPIRKVTSVVVDGNRIDDWVLRSNRLYRPQGWGNQQTNIAVTYEFGLSSVPKDIVKLVATLVAAGINEAKNGVGADRNLAYLSIDDYREGYRQGDNEIVDLTELPERTKRALAARFSGQAFVSRSL